MPTWRVPLGYGSADAGANGPHVPPELQAGVTLYQASVAVPTVAAPGLPDAGAGSAAPAASSEATNQAVPAATSAPARSALTPAGALGAFERPLAGRASLSICTVSLIRAPGGISGTDN